MALLIRPHVMWTNPPYHFRIIYYHWKRGEASKILILLWCTYLLVNWIQSWPWVFNHSLVTAAQNSKIVHYILHSGKPYFGFQVSAKKNWSSQHINTRTDVFKSPCLCLTLDCSYWAHVQKPDLDRFSWSACMVPTSDRWKNGWVHTWRQQLKQSA